MCIAASNGGTTSQDLKTGFWVGGTPWRQQIAILVGALASALVLGSLLIFLNDSRTYYQKVDPASPEASRQIQENEFFRENGAVKIEKAGGKYKDVDTAEYHVWQNTEPANGQVGKYLVNAQGVPTYFVDPGINGVLQKDDEGHKLERFDAPKATLMSYIIKGVLGQNLPWGLVILGAMIAVVLELSGVPALAFAVGIYLPISTSAPIFLGGIVRWLADIYLKRKFTAKGLNEEQVIAETDKSNGVLLASGYIAGGAIAGILIAVFAVWKFSAEGTVRWLTSLGVPPEDPSKIDATSMSDIFGAWADKLNPFASTAYWVGDPAVAGRADYSSLLGILPFLALAVILYLVGRELWLAGKKPD